MAEPEDLEGSGEASVPLPDTASGSQDGRERRLHLRAFDYWRSLKGEADLPFFRQLTVDGLAPFKDQSLLVERGALDESGSYQADSHITVRFFGTGLAPLFLSRPTVGDNFRDFSDSGFARELLSLLDNRSAADRAAEFEYVDLEVDSRGVMLPLSRHGGTVDFLWVVISVRDYGDSDADSVGPVVDDTVSGDADDVIDVAGEADYEGGDGAFPADPDPEPDTVSEPDADVQGAGDPDDLSRSDPGSSGDETSVGEDLNRARDKAERHRQASSPGYDRLYGLLADALRLYEQSQTDPAPLARQLEKAGLKVQTRAPYTPILKLIFGSDYDKTRLTEYGAAIAYAVREGVTSDGLAAFLSGVPGGIKGCVRAERAARRGDKTTTAHSRLKAARKRLRSAKTKPLEKVRLSGEFDLLLVRRGTDGTPEILGRADVGESTLSAIIERRARKARRASRS